MRGQRAVHQPTLRECVMQSDFPTNFGGGPAMEVKLNDPVRGDYYEWVSLHDLVTLDDLKRARVAWQSARALVDKYQADPDTSLEQLEELEQRAWDTYGDIAAAFGLCQQPNCPNKSDRAYCETHTPYDVEVIDPR